MKPGHVRPVLVPAVHSGRNAPLMPRDAVADHGVALAAVLLPGPAAAGEGARHLSLTDSENTAGRIGVTLEREGVRDQDVRIHISLLALPCLNGFRLYPGCRSRGSEECLQCTSQTENRRAWIIHNGGSENGAHRRRREREGERPACPGGKAVPVILRPYPYIRPPAFKMPEEPRCTGQRFRWIRDLRPGHAGYPQREFQGISPVSEASTVDQLTHLTCTVILDNGIRWPVTRFRCRAHSPPGLPVSLFYVGKRGLHSVQITICRTPEMRDPVPYRPELLTAP